MRIRNILRIMARNRPEKIATTKHDGHERPTSSFVSPEEFAYLSEAEQRILSGRKVYSWEPTDFPSTSPDFLHKVPEISSPHQSQSQVDLELIDTWEKPDNNSVAAHSQSPIPSFNERPEPTDFYIEASSDQDAGDVLPPEENEQYFSDDDPDFQSVNDGRQLFEEELLLDQYENEEDLDTDDSRILEDIPVEYEILDFVDIPGDFPTESALSIDNFYDYEPEEYDDEAGRKEFYEIETSGGVSKSTRSHQKAIEAGHVFGFDKKEIQVLAGIFEENGWGATRVAIERELSRGATIEEIHLASVAKRIWQEHSKYGCGCRTYYTLLSWPMALTLVRSFHGSPNSDVIENFLEQIFDHWRDSMILMRTFWPFSAYLSYRLGVTNGALDFMPDWSFEHHPDVRRETIHPPSSLDIPELDDTLSVKQLLRIRTNEFEY